MSKTTAVMLVSDQTMPNVLFIKEFPNADRYVFISTHGMEEKRCSTFIREACQEIPAERFAATVVLDAENNLQTIRKQLEQHFQPETDEHFLVNITGGTKIMSIATYNFFTQHHSELIYFTAGPNKYSKIFPQNEDQEKLTQCRVGWREYFAAHGVTVKSGGSANQAFNMSSADFLQYYLQFELDDQAVVSKLREVRNKMKKKMKKKKSIALTEVDGLTAFLHKWNLQPAIPEKLSKQEIKYLTGDWFETYAYEQVKKLLDLPDEAIATGIKIGAADEDENADNELDVVYVRNNKIYVIECKTSLGEQKTKILNETLYKSAALRSRFGLLVTTYLWALELEQVFKSGDYLKRAKLLQVTILLREALLDTDVLQRELTH